METQRCRNWSFAGRNPHKTPQPQTGMVWNRLAAREWGFELYFLSYSWLLKPSLLRGSEDSLLSPTGMCWEAAGTEQI